MLSELKILIVEDDATDRQLIRITLEKGLGDISLKEVTDLEQLGEALDQESFDIVLTDYKLTGFTGMDVLAEIRKTDVETPIVMLTGMESQDIALEAIKQGVDDYVLKSLEHIKRLPAKITAIVERRNMQKSVQKLEQVNFLAEADYRRLFQNSSDLIQIVDIHGNLIYANPSWYEVLGYQPVDLPELNLFDLIAPDSLQHCQTIFEQVLAGKKVENVRVKLLNKSGKTLLMDGDCICRYEEGTPVSVYSSFRNATTRSDHEEHGDVETERYISAFENSPIGIVIGDEYGKVLHLNQAACDLVGYTLEEMRGIDFRTISYPDDISESADNLKRLFSGEIESYHFEKRYEHKLGHIVWCDIAASLVRNPDGSPKFGLAQIKDITERKQAELISKKQTEFIHLLGKIAVAANEADSVETVLQVCVNEVCKYKDWPVAHASLLAPDEPEKVTPSKIWYLKDPGRYGLFRNATESMELNADLGEHGKVYDMEKFVWFEDLSLVTQFQRREEARAVGLKTACIFPVLVRKEVVAIIEFYNDKSSKRDDEFLEVMINVSAQVARVIERKRAEEVLLLSEEKFSTAFRSSPDAISITLFDDGALVEVNDSFLSWSGHTREELMGHTVIELGFWVDIKQREALVQELEHHGAVRNMNVEYRIKSGDIRNCQISAEKITVGNLTHMLVVIHDVTEKKLAEEALALSHRALRVLNESNHTIVHATSSQELINDICQIIVDTGGYRFTWVGYAQFDENKTVYPVGSAGHNAGYLDNTFTWGQQKGDKFDALGIAISNSRVCTIKNLATHAVHGNLITAALERGYRSLIVLPLTAGEETFGALVIYASEPDAFDEEEKKLLLRLADNLAFGILSMHERGQRERIEQSLRDRERKYRVLYDENPSMFFTLDVQGVLLSINEFGAETLGYSVEELIGSPISNICQLDDKVSFAKHLNQCLQEPGRVFRWEMQKVRKDGSSIWVRESARLVMDGESERKIFVVCEDITETRQLSEKLSYQATHDSLTGLINRGEFERHLEQLLSTIQKDNRQHTLCYLDLDQFKVMNDTCGHIAGDELLRQLGSMLKSKTRKRDTVARLGGDEFAIIMEDCEISTAEEVVKKFMDAITGFQFFWEGKSFKIGVSIGLVPINQTAGNLTSVLKKADGACYIAKDKGRNRIHIYDEDDHEIAQRQGEMLWVARIQQALEQDQFELYLQPIIAVGEQGRAFSRFEVLLRLNSDDGELIMPSAFLPAAERYNLSVKIDKWVIGRIFQLIAETSECQSGHYQFSINLSGHSIGNKELLDFALSELAKSNIPAQSICFEITETATIANLASAGDFIEQFKRQGCYFALDDFGSGLSSFAYLKNLQVDYLKIDGSFISDIVANPVNLAIVKSMNDIGKALGKQTVAEFVSDRAIMSILEDIGVDHLQGHHIGEPRAFSEMMSVFASGRVVELAGRR